MSLYPGAPRLDENNRHVLDDLALQQSMALAIEVAMNDVFQKVKGTPVPEVGKEDRRLLFVAISRGVLQYLESHQVTMNTTLAANGGPPRTGSIDLMVTMDRHLTHISLRLSPEQIAWEGTSDGTSDGTLELSDPAPQGGANVTVSADNSVVTLSSGNVTVAAPNPLSIKVPEGQRTAKFKVQAVERPTPIDEGITITASFAGRVTKTARLRVLQS
jgi:hypothetical protein